MGETGLHVRAILHLYSALRIWFRLFRPREDVYVAADMFLYYEQGNPRAQVAPDVMVVFGVPGEPERRTFKTWEEQAVPVVIFEITSRSTRREDTHRKRSLYARLGVPEYFIFDPLREYLPNALVGMRLMDGQYEELAPDADGSMNSGQIGARLLPDDELLRIVEEGTGRIVPAQWETEADLDAAQMRVNQRIAAQLRNAEGEIARLRALLERREGHEG